VPLSKFTVLRYLMPKLWCVKPYVMSHHAHTSKHTLLQKSHCMQEHIQDFSRGSPGLQLLYPQLLRNLNLESFKCHNFVDGISV